MSELLHITTQADWAAAQQNGQYTVESLETEGFIHCSTAAQVAQTANRFYRGVSGLVLLHIDANKVQPEIKWEAADGDLFPHIYGPLNPDAVLAVTEFLPDEDGVYRYPLNPQ